MSTEVPDPSSVDQVQIFDAGDVLRAGSNALDPVDMATSPNCQIKVVGAAQNRELPVPAEQDADTIFLVLSGETTLESPFAHHELKPDQGALIPAGVAATFRSTSSDEDLVLLSFRTVSGESRPGFIPNMPSGVKIRVPAAEVTAGGIGKHLYVFAVDQRTIRVGVNASQEWNKGALIRMNCEYEQSGDDLLVNLPEKMARWYRARELRDGDYRIVPQPGQTSVLIDLSPLIEREAAHP